MSAQRRFFADATRRGVWLLQWLLVLLIAFDQFGSPLHRHHHDSGVDAAHLAMPAVAHGHPLAHSLLERDDHGAALYHSNTVVRSEARALSKGDELPDEALPLFIATLWPGLLVPLCQPHCATALPAAPERPLSAGLHELLPEGRAPPRRA